MAGDTVSQPRQPVSGSRCAVQVIDGPHVSDNTVRVHRPTTHRGVHLTDLNSSAVGHGLAASAVNNGGVRAAWTQRLVAVLVAGVAAGVAIRLALLWSPGFRDDTDAFARWTAHIAQNGLGRAFDENLSFGPVMAWIWGAVGSVEPAFRQATSAADPGLSAWLKLPAVLADLGLAAGVAFVLRARPVWAVAGAVAVLLHPATWYVSAWWGQYESVYALAGLIAVIAAINGRDGVAAVALALAVLTKPQALPLLVPFAAWFFARGGIRGLARAGAVGLVAAVVIWLPFIAAAGPVRYLENLAEYQNDIFSVLSLRAWNLWWLAQEYGVGGEFASDRITFIGPISFRLLGFLVTGLLAIVVAARVYRDPQARTLVLGCAAITLVAFTFLTTMHERYAYAALVFLMLLIPEPRVRAIAVAFGIVHTLNLVAAIPATAELGRLLPVGGLSGIAGSIAMVALTFATLGLTLNENAKRSHQAAWSAVPPS